MSRPARPSLVVALTGGIGSGKTSVSDRLAALGAAVIDTDHIAHALTRPDGAAMAAIAQAFGPGLIAADGSLARPEMRRRVFSDPGARQCLEAILHPLIREQVAESLPRVRAPYAVIAVPLLFETGWTDIGDRILVVDLPEALQLARVLARGGLDEAEALRIIASQVSRATRRQGADDIIDNSGSREALLAQVDELHQAYLRLARP